MKKCIGFFALVVLCVVFAFSMAEGLLEVADYSIPEINLDDKAEDYYGVWKCVYASTSDTIYDYGSIVDYLTKHNMTMEYDGKTYSYSELGKDFFFVIEGDKTYQIMGNLRIEEPFEYTKEIAADHSGVFMLRDGNMIFQNLESGENYIFEKQTALQLLEYALANNKTEAVSTDFSAMSYSELTDLKDKINLAMWNSQEWQEVMVPEGVYVIGKDIPAGKWTISAPEKLYSVQIAVGPKLFDNGRVNYDNFYALYGKENTLNKENEGRTTFISIELKKDQYISIEDGSAIFTPFTGNSFTFK